MPAPAELGRRADGRAARASRSFVTATPSRRGAARGRRAARAGSAATTACAPSPTPTALVALITDRVQTWNDRAPDPRSAAARRGLRRRARKDVAERTRSRRNGGSTRRSPARSLAGALVIYVARLGATTPSAWSCTTHEVARASLLVLAVRVGDRRRRAATSTSLPRARPHRRSSLRAGPRGHRARSSRASAEATLARHQRRPRRPARRRARFDVQLVRDASIARRRRAGRPRRAAVGDRRRLSRSRHHQRRDAPRRAARRSRARRSPRARAHRARRRARRPRAALAARRLRVPALGATGRGSARRRSPAWRGSAASSARRARRIVPRRGAARAPRVRRELRLRRLSCRAAAAGRTRPTTAIAGRSAGSSPLVGRHGDLDAAAQGASAARCTSCSTSGAKRSVEALPARADRPARPRGVGACARSCSPFAWWRRRRQQHAAGSPSGRREERASDALALGQARTRPMIVAALRPVAGRGPVQRRRRRASRRRKPEPHEIPAILGQGTGYVGAIGELARPWRTGRRAPARRRASVCAPWQEHHAIRLNVADYEYNDDPIDEVFGGEIGHSGPTSPISVSAGSTSRAACRSGLSLRARRVTPRTRYALGRLDGFPGNQSDTKATGYAARGLIGWSWLGWKRVFLAAAVGASVGRYAGTEATAEEYRMPTFVTNDFAPIQVDAEAYLRFGVAFESITNPRHIGLLRAKVRATLADSGRATIPCAQLSIQASCARALSALRLSAADARPRRDPVGERRDEVAVLAGRHVLLLDRRDALGGEHAVAREADERGPHAAVDERDLAVDELEAADVDRVVDLGQRVEDRLALGMRPPAADDRLAGDRLGDARHRAARRREHDAVLLDELEPARRSLARRLLRLAPSSPSPSCGLRLASPAARFGCRLGLRRALGAARPHASAPPWASALRLRASLAVLRLVRLHRGMTKRKSRGGTKR